MIEPRSFTIMKIKMMMKMSSDSSVIRSGFVWRRSSRRLSVQWKRPTVSSSRLERCGPNFLCSAAPGVLEENRVTSTTSWASEQEEEEEEEEESPSPSGSAESS